MMKLFCIRGIAVQQKMGFDTGPASPKRIGEAAGTGELPHAARATHRNKKHAR
jgi:hypothetical protein